ncbi:MAG: NAD(P)-dependent oxidoreductase [Alphaproteobacteria bacterium]|nr:NAD(P)-dependent oxidoreductase [Alphaproteobacteria bacterium]
MKSVLVTGGSGYVGRFIVDELHRNGWKVTIAGRHGPVEDSMPSDIGFQPLALEPSADFVAALQGFNALVHAGFSHEAGRYRGGEGRNVRGFWDRNCLASQQLFEAARKTNIERIVFLSSRAVYGRQVPGLRLTENTPCHPDTHYGLIKFACEQHLASLAYSSGLSASSLRATGVYGVLHAGAAHKWHSLIRDYLAGRPIDPRQGTEVHGRDVAKAVCLLLQAPREHLNIGPYNLSDMLIDRNDILMPVRDHFGCEHPLPARLNAATYNVMDTSKLAQLGWQPGGHALFDRTMREILAGQSESS